MNSFGKRCGLVCASNPLLWQDYIYLQDFAEEGFIVINFANLRTCIAGKSSTPAKSPWPGTDMALPCLKEPDAVHCYSSQISSEIHLLFSALVRPSDSQASYTCDQTDPYWHKQSKAPAGAPRCCQAAPTAGHSGKHGEAGQRPFVPLPLTDTCKPAEHAGAPVLDLGTSAFYFCSGDK